MRRVIFTIILAIATTLSAVVGVGSAAAATGCRTDWGSLAESSNATSTGHLKAVRVGRHRCYDRMVVDLDGPATGYIVEYVPELTADGSGHRVPVSGGAIIRVVALAPAYDDNGKATVDPAKVSATSVRNHRTFRDVEWAGSFEGRTTIGLGVRARLPFRVFTLAGPGQGSRLVIDVAHTW